VLTACGGGTGEADAGTASASSVASTPDKTSEALAPTAGGASAIVGDVPTSTVMMALMSVSAAPAPTLATTESAPVATVADAPATDTATDDERSMHALATSSTTMVPAGPGSGTTPSGTGVATLNWAAPATKANGTAVGSLSGYRIYYGTASGKYIGNLLVSGGTATGGAVSGLATGKWYFTVAAVDTSGNESTIGYEMSKSL
jgi:hypothetical protein